MRESRNSTRARRICFDAHKWTHEDSGRTMLTCHVCGGWIDVVKTPNDWIADHIKRWAEGGEDTPENLYPICLDCNAVKSPKDTSDIAHGKRAGNKHFGIKQRGSSWRKW